MLLPLADDGRITRRECREFLLMLMRKLMDDEDEEDSAGLYSDEEGEAVEEERENELAKAEEDPAP